jgi:solute carrier family 25 (mitochondrial adenine nucleotide translocator), member 4/5/6/31
MKILMQTQSTSRQLVGGNFPTNMSPLRRATLTLQQQGFWSLWRGNLANVIRYFPNQSLSLAVKDRLRDLFVGSSSKQDKDLSRMFYGSLAAGGIAGGICLAGTYPLDLVRTIQAGDVSNTSFSSTKTSTAVSSSKQGIIQSLKTVYMQGYTTVGLHGNQLVLEKHSALQRHMHGIAALYRGFNVSVVLVVLYKGLHLGGYDIAKDLYSRAYGDKHPTNTMLSFGFAWAWSLIVGSTCYPFDTMRRRLMCGLRDADGQLVYRNAFHCFQKMVKEEGVGSLYRGVGVNVLRSIGGAITLVAYDKLKDVYA